MADRRVKLVKTTMSEAERKRRLSMAYAVLMDAANGDAPASEAGEPGAGASSDDNESRRRGHGTAKRGQAQGGG